MKKNPLFGLRKSRRSPHVNWALDIDYADKLGPEERDWLSQFLNEYYLSAGRKPGKNVHDDDGLRQCWKEYKQRQRAECIMSYREAYRGTDALARQLEKSLFTRTDEADALEKPLEELTQQSLAKQCSSRNPPGDVNSEDTVIAWVDNRRRKIQ